MVEGFIVTMYTIVYSITNIFIGESLFFNMLLNNVKHQLTSCCQKSKLQKSQIRKFQKVEKKAQNKPVGLEPIFRC